MTRAEVTRLFRQAEAEKDFPGSYFPALGKAQAALATWRTEHPEEAKEEDDLKALLEARQAAQRKEDYEASFIGRGLD